MTKDADYSDSDDSCDDIHLQETLNEPEDWDGLTDDDLRELIGDCDEARSEVNNTPVGIKKFITWCVYFILVWQYSSLISDSAIEHLLKFLKAFFTVLGQRLGIELIISFATLFPGSLYMLRKHASIDRDDFDQFAVCPRCTKLYSFDDCVEKQNGRLTGKLCNNVLFPKAKRKKECGSPLVREVILKGGQRKFYPLKIYCYKSLISTLETFLKRPGFEEECMKWRERDQDPDIYGDVFDGKVWKDFEKVSGKKFLQKKRTFGLMLNCDWFQPFERRKDYSVGVLYMVVLNLPREKRFKKENVILLGVIPALDKEPSTVNAFLKPAVDELTAMWNGVLVNTFNSPKEPVKMKGALLCCAADIPAARKICGILGHSARRGCSHCLKEFPGGFGEKRDYSGFDNPESWPKRTDEQHRRDAKKTSLCPNASSKKKMEKNLGSRYTVLLELPYFAAITMCIIDPMHNLFLGTAKKVFKLWMDEIFTREDIQKLQQRVESIQSLSDIGRLPGKIVSNYGGFTASQWKNWTLYYSMYALEGVLPNIHIHYWQSFVLACRLLCKPSISKTDLFLANRKLLDFVRGFERINGKSKVTPNMHLHIHLKSSVENFGSVYGFWLFSFERYNGILGSFHTNFQSVELQLMRKFLCMNAVFEMQYLLPFEYSEELLEICNSLKDRAVTHQECVLKNQGILMKAASRPISECCSIWTDLTSIELPDRYTLTYFDSDDLHILASTYAAMYPEWDLNTVSFGHLYKRYTTLHFAGENYGTQVHSRLYKYARIMASWAGDDGSIQPGPARPGRIKEFAVHSVEYDGKEFRHVFAVIEWSKTRIMTEQYRNPLTVWDNASILAPGAATFMPVQRIHGRYLSVKETVGGVDNLVVCSVQRSFYM